MDVRVWLFIHDKFKAQCATPPISQLTLHMLQSHSKEDNRTWPGNYALGLI